jgi:hypothetical protein
MKIFTFFLFLFPFLAIGQDAAIDVAFGTQHSIWLDKKNINTGEIVSTTKGAFSPAFGIAHNYKVSDKNWLRMGLRYNTNAITTNIKGGHDGNGGFSGNEITKIEEQLVHIDAFFAFRHFFTQKKLSFFIEPQISVGSWRGVYASIDDGERNFSKNKNAFKNSIVSTAGLGIGAEYPLTTRLKLVTQLNSNVTMYYLRPAPIRDKIFNFYNTNGIDIGLRYFY